MARGKALGWLIAPLVVLSAAAYAAADYVRAAGFVVRAAGMHGYARTLADLGVGSVRDERLTIPWRGGELPARWYHPARTSDRPILLVPGVHAAGVDEPRLDGVARNLAGMGHPVLSVGLPDLA